MLNYSLSSIAHHIEWRIKREPVYRLLDDIKWLDNFFDSGEIKLSCLSNFRKYPNEIQGDPEEGNNQIAVTDDKGTLHILGYEAGLNAFILATAKQLNDKIKKDFNAKCALKINHPTLFALELAKKLPFVQTGLEGECIYAQSKSQFIEETKKEYNIFSSHDYKNPNFIRLMNEITMGIELFLKFDKYKYQDEYRFIWLSNNTVNDSIIIKCPEAIEYCEKIIF